MLPRHDQSIAAIATAPGRGAVGIVRVSGAAVRDVIAAVCGRELKPREATYLPFLAADASAIDQGLAIHFPGPHSYTGEDVLELQAHGGPVVLQLLLARCLEAGAAAGLRVAEPGEFTERAFLNDKIDLAQAEAIADLIDASTEAAARSASRSLSGEFSREVHALRDALIHLRMLVEATLDFPEEEIDFLQKADAQGQLDRLQQTLARVMQRARQGALLREGIKVVIAGQPNAGKSSLLNALAGAELAIVTPVPGTTRDVVSQTIQIEGVPLHVIDTAGLRESEDHVEKIGIERAWGQIESADAVLFLHDLTRAGDADYAAGDATIAQHARAETAEGGAGDRCVEQGRRRPGFGGRRAGRNRTTNTSCCRPRPARASTRCAASCSKSPAGSRRPKASTSRASATCRRCAASTAISRKRPLHLSAQAQALELLAEELRLAQNALSEITGEFTSDDLLGVIFSKFCIGK